jgi:DNA-binding cell septation regulator SpoVG
MSKLTLNNVVATPAPVVEAPVNVTPSTITWTIPSMRKFSGESKTLAFFDVVVNGVVTIKNLRLVQGKNGPFVGYPQTKRKDGSKWDDDMFISDAIARDELVKVAVATYNVTPDKS